LRKRSTGLVLCLCAALAVAVAVGSGAAEPSDPVTASAGTRIIVIPRLLGLDVENAVAEVEYLRMIATLVDRDVRPSFDSVRDGTTCKVIEQDPRPRREVVVSDLTVTVTITVRCRAAGRRRCREPRQTHRKRPGAHGHRSRSRLSGRHV
jgi:hypothetical protein